MLGLERRVIGKNIKKGALIAGGALSTLAVIGCSGDDNQREVNISYIPKTPASQINVLAGDDFSISKLGEGVFILSGGKQEKAVEYISEKCRVLNVAPWSLRQSGAVTSIDTRVVTVDKGDCIPELNKNNQNQPPLR